MALIICPECGKKFSDRAVACPECGCPTSEISGQSSNASEGQIIIANNAFDDSRYDEAYQLFAQLYAQNQSNPQIAIRLGLATAARDYFNNGIPNSTKDLLSKGLELAKNNASSYDAFVSQITPYIIDTKKVIGDTKNAVIEGISSALNQTASMRGAGEMVVDALFSPVVSANRNLYEDRRTAEANSRILNNAIANKKVITATLDAFGSFVLKTVADLLTEPLDNDNALYAVLGDFVANGDDAKIYEKLCASPSTQGNVYGLCYGEEKTLLEFSDTYCIVRVNGEPRVKAHIFEGTPKGHVLLTNYRVVYKATKDKFSFEESLENLIRVEVGGPLNVFITLCYPNNLKVLISPVPEGTQAVYVATINEMLKMPNR